MSGLKHDCGAERGEVRIQSCAHNGNMTAAYKRTLTRLEQSSSSRQRSRVSCSVLHLLSSCCHTPDCPRHCQTTLQMDVRQAKYQIQYTIHCRAALRPHVAYGALVNLENAWRLQRPHCVGVWCTELTPGRRGVYRLPGRALGASCRRTQRCRYRCRLARAHRAPWSTHNRTSARATT